MSRRSGILEFAVLGLLREAPMHGYELRKRLNTSLGVFRAFSYGTLYPCLKTLVANGWLIEEPGSAPEDAARRLLAGRRAKIVYRLTAEGKEHFEELLSQTGPTPGRTSTSPFASPSSGRPNATCACASWRAAAAGWRSAWRRCAPLWPAPASASTTTPSSCSATGWSPWSARCAG